MERTTEGVEPALVISGLSKTFGLKTVLHPFDLELQRGEIHALLGQNGSGKSTLIKLLSGYHTPDDGGVVVIAGQSLDFGSPKGSLGVGLRVVHQDLGLVGESSVLDNLAIGLGYPTRFGTIRRSEARRESQIALDAVGLDVSVDQLVSELKPAQRTGLAVARAMQARAGEVAVLILDEPTATLPAKEVENLHRMLLAAASRGVAILYVTHHLDEVETLANRVSILRDGHLVITADVADIPRDQLVHHLIGGAVEQVIKEQASENHQLGDAPVVLDIDELRAENIDDVSLQVRRGEIVGVYGLTGSGRETLLGAVFGAQERAGGDVRVNGTVLVPNRPNISVKSGVGYLGPDRKRGGGMMQLTAKENLTIPDISEFWRTGWLRRKAERIEAGKWLDRLQVRPAGSGEALLASFSGGNQQKVLIGKWIRVAQDVLLLDEPTQGVDVGAKAELHRQILGATAQGTAILVSSTDVEELAVLCDRVLIIRGGRIADELVGNDVTESEINRRLHSSPLAKAAS